jgi:type I restriction enzyme M protein
MEYLKMYCGVGLFFSAWLAGYYQLNRNTIARPDSWKGIIEKMLGMIILWPIIVRLSIRKNIALDPSQTINALKAYFLKEVQPHVPDAWIDASIKDAKDQQIGIVGYEVPFNRHFYQYQPLRDLTEIDADLDAVSAEFMALLQEVHS